jgi:two-component system nitrogen regulation sensor histidine kinase GlnL
MTANAPVRTRQSRAMRADRVADAVPIALLGIDAQGAIAYANAAAIDLLGAERRLEGAKLVDVAGAGGEIAATLVEAAILRGAAARASGVALTSAYGESVLADLAAAPLDDGATLAIKPVAQGEAALPTRGPPALARTLAHEVRNPLAGIRAAAQLIGRTAGPDAAQLAELIVAEVDRIRRLTDRIDALEGMPPPRLGPVNVHEALARVRAVIAQGFPGLILIERYDPSLPSIQADMDQLIQAFLNIAKNAAEAVADLRRPEIVLATAYRPGFRVRTGAGGAARPQLEVLIEDNGPGLPAHLTGRAFEPFVSTKRGGMGLGLAVAAEIVARHDGRIETDRREARTQFRILLPIDRMERRP